MRKLGVMQYESPDYSMKHPSINYSKNVIEVIAEIFGVELVDKKVQLFLTEDELAAGKSMLSPYKKPITFNPYAVCSKNKEWDTRNWEELIRIMPEYPFIQLGLRKEALIPGAVDLRGLSVRQSMAVIGASSYYIGVDSFLNHVAAALNTPAIILFGASSPEVFGHSQNVNISKRLWCSPCIDFIAHSACPYGRECMHRISVKEVKAAIHKLQDRKKVMNILSTPIDETF
jgi:ADP-heptose:LPS heptosyltransferase